MFRKLLFGAPDPKEDSVKIAWHACESAFGIFRNEDFRKQLAFTSLTQLEQDRIFNELVVTAITLAYFQTETLIRFHEGEFQKYLKSIKENVLIAYRAILTTLGIPSEHLLT
jgi:hypothetical protein